MSAAGPTRTLRTMKPLMSIPRIAPAPSRASSVDPASFTPPALPRPPTSTWALITTLPAPSSRNRWAAATASSAYVATPHGGTGRPWATRRDFASASWIFTGEGRLPDSIGGRGRDGTASGGDGTIAAGRLAILDERG